VESPQKNPKGPAGSTGKKLPRNIRIYLNAEEARLVIEAIRLLKVKPECLASERVVLREVERKVDFQKMEVLIRASPPKM